MNYHYPYDKEKKATLSVTKDYKPFKINHYLSLVQNEDSILSATDKGTLVHLLLSHLSFRDHHLPSLIEQLYQQGLYDEKAKTVLLDYQTHLQAFIDSEIYQKIKYADHIYKPFCYYDIERQQTIHGIFDLVFIHNDSIYVLDYKTDRVSSHNSQEALIEKLRVRLNYYQKVLKEMYKKEVHAIVYYLHIHQAVEF